MENSMTVARRFGFAIVLLAIALVVIVLFFLDVDSCLDAGGRWNEEDKVCEFSKDG